MGRAWESSSEPSALIVSNERQDEIEDSGLPQSDIFILFYLQPGKGRKDGRGCRAAEID
jgi:hypothetical protein